MDSLALNWGKSKVQMWGLQQGEGVGVKTGLAAMADPVSSEAVGEGVGCVWRIKGTLRMQRQNSCG